MLTSRILKGGALLTESRILVENWNSALDPSANLDRLVKQNLLGKTSASRANDVVRTVLRPRLVEPGPQVVEALRELLEHPTAFREACYFEATRADELLATFAEDPLGRWYADGRIAVNVLDVADWLDKLRAQRRIPEWSEQVRDRVVRGMLSTLRDFGILRGAARKEFASPVISPAGFAYVAFRLHESGVSSPGLSSSSVWRRWLLGPAEVEQLFAEAAHQGVLRHSRAGSLVRVDWQMPSLVEVAHSVA